MKTAIIGYPRIGENRELKFAIEKYWKNEITENELLKIAEKIRRNQWLKQKEEKISFIPGNTFSFYDGILDTIILLNAIPKHYRDLGLNELNTYFAIARGYQGEKGDVKALSMRKWYNTNYHYMVPELDDYAKIKLNADKIFSELEEAEKLGVNTHPSVIGPFTFYKLAKTTGNKDKREYLGNIINAYVELLEKCNEKNIEWIQIEEPQLVTDQTEEDIKLFEEVYTEILKNKKDVKVLLQTYFGDVRDCYGTIIELDFDGIGLDFTEGRKTEKLIAENGFPKDKVLFAGVVNGKNIWKCDYRKVLNILNNLKGKAENIVVTTSCSLLHVPYTLRNEEKLSENILKHFSFAEEKLGELRELGKYTGK